MVYLEVIFESFLVSHRTCFRLDGSFCFNVEHSIFLEKFGSVCILHRMYQQLKNLQSILQVPNLIFLNRWDSSCFATPFLRATLTFSVQLFLLKCSSFCMQLFFGVQLLFFTCNSFQCNNNQ